MNLINTVENSLIDLEKKGNLDLAFESYNPNSYFDKVYHVTYEPKDLELDVPKGIEIVCPAYFKLLNRCKKYNGLKFLLFPFVYTAHILYLFYFIKTKNVSVARGRMPYLMSLALGISSKMARIPFIVSLGGDNRLAQEKIGKYHLFNSKKLSYFVEEAVLRIADGAIVPNEYTERYVKNISSQERIYVNPLPIRRSFFEDRNSKAEKRDNYILFVGRLVGDKHPDFVIEVFHEYIKRKNDDKLSLKIVGDGPMAENLLQLAVEFGLEDRVEFLGFKGADELSDLIKKAKVSLIPVSGFVIYESAVYSTPIITSDTEWHSEFISHGENGWICKYLDKKSWVDTLVDVLSEYDKSLMIARNLTKNLDQFDPNNVYSKDIEIYQGFLNS